MVFGCRWTTTMVKERVFAPSLNTNQAMGSHIVRRIKSFLEFMEEVTWCHKVNSYGWKWFKSLHKVDLLMWWSTQSWLHLLVKKYVNYDGIWRLLKSQEAWLQFQEEMVQVTYSRRICSCDFIFDLEYGHFVLSRRMQHWVCWQVSVLKPTKPKRETLANGGLEACF